MCHYIVFINTKIPFFECGGQGFSLKKLQKVFGLAFWSVFCVKIDVTLGVMTTIEDDRLVGGVLEETIA